MIEGEECILTIPFHGDQLFEERARNTQWTYQLGDTEMDRLQGIDTEFADWHAKYNLFMVIFWQNKILITEGGWQIELFFCDLWYFEISC